MTKPIAHDPIYRRRRFEAEMLPGAPWPGQGIRSAGDLGELTPRDETRECGARKLHRRFRSAYPGRFRWYEYSKR